VSEPTSSLERRIEELSRDVERLCARVARLESAEAPIHRGAEGAPAETGGSVAAGAEAGLELPSLADGESLVALAGRTFIALGGAFLLRALSEGAYLAPAVGAFAGLLYALAWLVAADRDAQRGRAVSAGFHALVTVAVGYPLIVEASLRFRAFSASMAAAAAPRRLAGTLAVAAATACARSRGCPPAPPGSPSWSCSSPAATIAGPGLRSAGAGALRGDPDS